MLGIRVLFLVLSVVFAQDIFVTVCDFFRQSKLVIDVITCAVVSILAPKHHLIYGIFFLWVITFQVFQLVVHVAQKLVQLTVVCKTWRCLHNCFYRLGHWCLIIQNDKRVVWRTDLVRVHDGQTASKLTELLIIDIVDWLKLAKHLRLLEAVLLRETLTIVLIFGHEITSQIMVISFCNGFCEIKILLLLVFFLTLVR